MEEDENKIEFQAWGSFFSIESSQRIAPGSKFYANQEYKEQLKRTTDSSESDMYGPINIPSEKSFWIIQNKKGVYYLSSRRDAITKFKHFTPFSNLKEGEQAMNELGQFDEGYCVQINSIGVSDIVCFSSSTVLAKFMATLKAMAGSSSTKAQDQIDFQAQLSERESQIIEDYPKLSPNGAELHGGMGGSGGLQKDSVWKLL